MRVVHDLITAVALSQEFAVAYVGHVDRCYTFHTACLHLMVEEDPLNITLLPDYSAYMAEFNRKTKGTRFDWSIQLDGESFICMGCCRRMGAEPKP